MALPERIEAASEGGSRLKARDVEFAYLGTPVLRGVSAQIVTGSLTALVGPNGSGKSTLLSTLARFLAPSAGAVTLDGRAIGALPTKAVARELAILPQSPPLPENITVFELVSRGRYPHLGFMGLLGTRDIELVEAAMAMTGVRELAARPVDGLSGGQRQRAWIAMALAQETPIILLDEPTSALDLRFQLEILELLRTLTRQHGRTVVAALHDLNLAAAHADQIIFFRDGAIRAAGPTREVCTPQTIEAVFGVTMLSMPHPETGRPFFMPRTRNADV